MKVISIVGARPQFIKASIVCRAFSKFRNVKKKIIHTGQHYDSNMSSVFFTEMQIPLPDHNLNIADLSHGAMTGRMLEQIEKVLQIEKPDYVIVYGDTNSTLAGALAARKLDLRIAHVEAGLRSFNMRMPEEINRILTDRISDLLLCPTIESVENLKREGYSNFDCKIIRSGDVMYDASKFYSSVSDNVQLDFVLPEKFVLCTFHRAENTDDVNRLKSIVSALNRINKNMPVIVPMHPRTRKNIQNYTLKCEFRIIEPLGYLEMIKLIKGCLLIMTDSGGLQKEAFFFQKPCVTLRDETEWVELVKNKCNLIAGTQTSKIISCYNKILKSKINFGQLLYGNGKAGEKIARAIMNN